MKKFRWAFIGASNIAYNVAKMITSTHRHEVIGIWNRTIEKAYDFSNIYGSKVYQTLEELYEDKSIDGIYIAVTTNMHYDLVMQALTHYIPVLVEKPFSVNHQEAIRMFDFAKQQKTYLAEAMWTWFNDTAITVKQWINERFVGDIKKVNIDYSLPLIHYLKSPRLLDVNQCGGALMDIGVYPIHYAVQLFGPPLAIKAEGLVKDGVDHQVDVTLTYSNFDVNLRIAMDRYQGERFTVYGTKGYIRIPWFHMSHRATGCTLTRERRLFIDKHGRRNELLIVEFDRVAEEIRQGKIISDYVTPSAVIETFKIMDTIRQQIGVIFPRDLEVLK